MNLPIFFNCCFIHVASFKSSKDAAAAILPSGWGKDFLSSSFFTKIIFLSLLKKKLKLVRKKKHVNVFVFKAAAAQQQQSQQ